jgi:DNA-binding FadR family transcriptional regulator
MSDQRSQSAITLAASRLRAMVLSVPEGSFLDGEEAVQQRLGVSRPTLRQAARVLEREGLLRVRRGNNGGYFSARPNPDFIETTVASYLEVLQARPEDVARVATALWIEVVGKAAGLPPEQRSALAGHFKREIGAIAETAGFSEILALEQKIGRHVFVLIESPYVELIFNINANYARRRMTEPPAQRDGTPQHAVFVAAWRKAKLMELEAISNGDTEIASILARRCRELIQVRVWPALA